MSNVVVQPTWKVLEISWNVKKCNRLQSVLEVASSRCYNVASRASWFWNLQWNGLPADTDWKHINLGSNANHQDKFKWIHVPQILFEFLVLKNKHLNIFASSGYFVLEIQETDGHSHMGSAQAFLPWSTKISETLRKTCHRMSSSRRRAPIALNGGHGGPLMVPVTHSQLWKSACRRFPAELNRNDSAMFVPAINCHDQEISGSIQTRICFIIRFFLVW